MPQITDILSNFTDTELAYLYKFRLASYLPATQEKIKEYILRERGLDESTINNLVLTNITRTSSDHTQECPKCKSDKFIHDTDKVSCIVCGHTLVDFDKEEMRSELKEGFWELLGHIGEHI
ncbi:MAG: hypothetical protein WAQ28_19090 [Bacteroidia bacterium]|jgi:hypothetical protein